MQITSPTSTPGCAKPMNSPLVMARDPPLMSNSTSSMSWKRATYSASPSLGKVLLQRTMRSGAPRLRRKIWPRCFRSRPCRSRSSRDTGPARRSEAAGAGGLYASRPPEPGRGPRWPLPGYGEAPKEGRPVARMNDGSRAIWEAVSLRHDCSWQQWHLPSR